MKVQKISQVVLPVMTAMVLLSCSKDSVVTVPEAAPIAFKVFANVPSKASVVESAQLASQSITIEALSGTNGTTAFFKDVFSSSSGVWGPSSGGKYYWPSTGALSFLAYYPADLRTAFGDGVAVATTSVTEGAQSSISTVKPQQQASAQADLLVGKTVGVANGEAVNLYMRHVLSQIEVQARCLNPNIKILVKGVKLVNIYQQAKLNIPTAGTTSDGTLNRDIWQNAASNGKTTYYAGGETSSGPKELIGASGAISQSIMMDEGSFMLIPQSNGTWNGTNTSNVTGSYLAVLCQIWQKNSSTGTDYPTLIYPSSSDKYGWAAVGIGPDWQPGVKYTYTLEFFKNGGGAGSIPPDQTNPNTDNPQEVEEGQGGTSVAGALSFTVTAATWGGEDGGGELTPAEASSLAFPEANLITLENQQ